MLSLFRSQHHQQDLYITTQKGQARPADPFPIDRVQLFYVT